MLASKVCDPFFPLPLSQLASYRMVLSDSDLPLPSARSPTYMVARADHVRHHLRDGLDLDEEVVEDAVKDFCAAGQIGHRQVSANLFLQPCVGV